MGKSNGIVRSNPYRRPYSVRTSALGRTEAPFSVHGYSPGGLSSSQGLIGARLGKPRSRPVRPKTRFDDQAYAWIYVSRDMCWLFLQSTLYVTTLIAVEHMNGL